MWKSKLGKTTERREKIHYYQEVTTNFRELCCGYSLLDPIHFLLREEGLFVLYCWLGRGQNAGEIGVTANDLNVRNCCNSCDCGRLIIGITCRKSFQSITAQDVMIVGEVRLSKKSVVAAICWQRSRRAVVVAILLGAKVSGKECTSGRSVGVSKVWL